MYVEFQTEVNGTNISHLTSANFVRLFDESDTSEDELNNDIEQYSVELEDLEVNGEEEIYEDVPDVDYRSLFVDHDTIVVPAKSQVFNEQFIGKNRWYSIRISNDRIPFIKYIAAYRTQPISKVTHIARVKEIVESPYDPNKKMIIFDGEARELSRYIPLGRNYQAMQSSRYTTLEKFTEAENVDELFE